MPLHLSTWTHARRRLGMAVIATVGMSTSMGRVWGPKGVKEAKAALKKRDDSRVSEVTSYTKFNDRIGKYYDKGIPAEEYAKVQIFAMEYFQSQANPKASFVKDKGSSTLKRIEILGDEGWLDLWTA